MDIGLLFIELAQAWGYPGILLVNFIGAATIIFPLPAFAVVFLFGSILNPWLVGILAGIGATLGELTGYVLGKGGGYVLKKKQSRYSEWLERGKLWMGKYKAFPLIVLFAATPLPDDVLGILLGAMKYDLRKFLAAMLIGKTAMNIALALGGFYGIGWVLSLFGWA